MKDIAEKEDRIEIYVKAKNTINPNLRNASSITMYKSVENGDGRQKVGTTNKAKIENYFKPNPNPKE